VKNTQNINAAGRGNERKEADKKSAREPERPTATPDIFYKKEEGDR